MAPHRHKNGKKTFTLVEILVCIAIIASVSVVLCWNVYGAMQFHRFDESVKKVRNEIESLQMLSLIFGSDTELKFEKQKDKWVVTPIIYEAILQKAHVKPFDLSGVTSLSWQDSEKNFTIKIYASGRFEPKGVLKISQDERVLYLDLQNPLSIKVTKEYPKIKNFQLPKKLK